MQICLEAETALGACSLGVHLKADCGRDGNCIHSGGALIRGGRDSAFQKEVLAQVYCSRRKLHSERQSPGTAMLVKRVFVYGNFRGQNIGQQNLPWRVFLPHLICNVKVLTGPSKVQISPTSPTVLGRLL